ncbi:LytR family transcriptional regulator [Lactiplantibacillus pentosus]|uniref:Transcription regulator n=1 Tax=Lactiplantibacillus pentosus IG1 TaxID=1042160 RepID=G0M2C9_LACPE|nr:LCP family protein [Lactiplantibacillus pentosus]CCC16218.1 transcription regulator [Lactiplantibacillus pentosus IG1]MCT3303049.1 LytR family transcriptional regulator [Lactiplantibacillus pentosus]PRO76818.1 LytR family transcriptional regulator [Lactiplantibacillus pentosus]PRO78724.1 LytR family transcriptional regulator [Lactiplantibacillus pentosus]PRO87934.1 LytR family transcriptional regulator [Lactiplantibacillus pentosus]
MEDMPSRSEMHRDKSQGNNSQGNGKGPKKKHPVRNTILIIIAVLLVGTGAFAARTYFNAKNAANTVFKSSGIKKSRNTSAVLNGKKPVSILLLGTDTGALGRNYKGRTDTIILATINPKTKTTTLMSLPRDSEVAVSGFEQDFPTKLNAAYAYGSAGTTIKTIQKWLNVPIDYYALINMGGMKKVINEIGGVDITPIRTFTYEGYTFTKGQKEHMNGAKALAYSRMRYDDSLGDYGRQQRQRQLITAILGESTSASNLLKQDFLDSLAKQTRTDLTFSNLTSIVTNYRSATKNIVSDHAQGTGKMIDGQSFEVVSQSEKQRVTNVLRKSLNLKAAKTGEKFANQN